MTDQQIIEALREAAETLSWCARKMKDLCAGRDDVAGVALAAGRAFDAMRAVENRAAAKEDRQQPLMHLDSSDTRTHIVTEDGNLVGLQDKSEKDREP